VTEANWEKRSRLGEAPIQYRSTESPRHRSARVPNTEASDTSRNRHNRAATEAAAKSSLREGNPERSPFVPPKRPGRRPPQDQRAAEATR
jgi:hypothetical protein